MRSQVVIVVSLLISGIGAQQAAASPSVDSLLGARLRLAELKVEQLSGGIEVMKSQLDAQRAIAEMSLQSLTTIMTWGAWGLAIVAALVGWLGWRELREVIDVKVSKELDRVLEQRTSLVLNAKFEESQRRWDMKFAELIRRHERLMEHPS